MSKFLNDRKENLRRIAHISKLFNDNENHVIASFVSPTNKMRDMIKWIIGKENFRLVYLDCSLEECENRDVKGMYREAREGKREGFTGLDSVFEIPEETDIVLNTETKDIDECVENIIKKLFESNLEKNIGILQESKI